MFLIVNKLAVNKKLIVQINFTRNFTKQMERNNDNRLEVFQRVCDEIAKESSYLNKAKVLQAFLQKGSDQHGFKGDMLLWVQMLIPGASQRVYNLQNKQMLKLFSRLFAADPQIMQLDLEQEGDVSETLSKFFESSKQLKPQSKSTLYLQEVDQFLLDLEQKTKEDEQTEVLKSLCKQATASDLKMIIRLIKQDLRINARARHILDALGPFAYPAYQSSRDLAAVVRQFGDKISATVKVAKTLDVSKKGDAAKKSPQSKVTSKVGQVQVMTPISPMLANACKSIDEALKKCPTGVFTEIKYDGERVQIHKSDMQFKFFSRNLKPVMEHKIKRFKEFIPKAFPGGGDMILDSEIILVDTKTGDLLPFGTLGAHKKKEFDNAVVCLFVFDCLLFNGDDLTTLTFRERRKILEDNIKPLQHYVQLSESRFLKTKNELSLMTAKVLKANLEGVVLKNPLGTYQPGKRGWLKVKKDYLFGGQMADTADLVVLGAWFGSGKKGGILSIFLMGCYDSRDGLWKTVTKVHSGLDDATNEEIHEKLLPLMERADENRWPRWMQCNRPLVPDYVAKVPKQMPVWEITGAEFTKSEAHTAAGISIRFPRITKLRDDKSAEQANDLKYLQELYDASKNNVNVDLLMTDCNLSADDNENKNDFITLNGKLNLSPMKAIKMEITDDVPKTDIKIAIEDDEPCCSKKLKLQLPADADTHEVHKEEKLSYAHKNRKIQSVDTKQSGEDKNTTKHKQSRLTFNKKASTAGEEQLFSGMVGYFQPDLNDAECVRAFRANGGVLTKDAAKATHAFYATTDVLVSLEEYRNKYKRSCRHLSVQWLRDTIQAKKFVGFGLYALVLRSSK